jgi:ATP synthase protein I
VYNHEWMPFNRPIPDPKPEPRNNGGIHTLVQAEKLTQIAVLLPSAAFIGWLAGAWLDSRLHQTWIALAGIVFGGISGLVYVVRLVISTGGSSHPPSTPSKNETPDSKP